MKENSLQLSHRWKIYTQKKSEREWEENENENVVQDVYHGVCDRKKLKRKCENVKKIGKNKTPVT